MPIFRGAVTENTVEYSGEKHKVKNCDMLLIGKVAKEPEIGETRNKKAPQVRFSVFYQDGKSMNVVCVGDCQQTAIAACLEKGDFVMVAGVWEGRPYVSKRTGENTLWSELKVTPKMNGVILVQGGNMPQPAPESGKNTNEKPADNANKQNHTRIQSDDPYADGPKASSMGDWSDLQDDDDDLPW